MPYPPMHIAVLEEYQTQEEAARRAIKETGVDLAPGDARALAERYPVLKRQSVTFVDGTSNLLVDKRHIGWIVGVVSLMAIPIAIFFRRASPTWLAQGSVGTMAHGAVVLVAAGHAFIPRYALPIDVMIIIALMLACDMGLAWLQSSGLVLLRHTASATLGFFGGRKQDVLVIV
jgi:hypothetical protein